ncbi:MAG: hypothetical protein VKJ06_01720 [Vampirovibrionales bacterium]|nr:hypothetical protein [Vampirovibrionales bacterium]
MALVPYLSQPVVYPPTAIPAAGAAATARAFYAGNQAFIPRVEIGPAVGAGLSAQFATVPAKNAMHVKPGQRAPVALASHTEQASNRPMHLLGALGYALSAVLIGRLGQKNVPGLLAKVKPPAMKLFSLDIKDWLKTGLAVQTVSQMNQAFNVSPPPWALALETVTVMTPLLHGPLNKKGWANLPLLALTIPALVQGTHALSERLNHVLENTERPVPKWLPQTALSLGSAVVGFVGLRRLIQHPTYQKLLGKAGLAAAATDIMACTRCGGVHSNLICTTEVAEALGGAGAWLQSKFSDNS